MKPFMPSGASRGDALWRLTGVADAEGEIWFRVRKEPLVHMYGNFAFFIGLSFNPFGFRTIFASALEGQFASGAKQSIVACFV